MSHIDWKTELKKIEREFSGLPPIPTEQDKRQQRALEQRERERQQARAAMLGTWARLVLVAALGGAILLWPYPRDCGVGLFAYLFAELLIVAGGVWTAVYAWKHRLAIPHGLALLMLLWGLALLELQVLPRVGYAKVDARNPPGWRCTARATRG
jgi:hypothetical protein